MATSKEIKKTFLDELKNAVGTQVDTQNIRLATNTKDVELPSLLYDDFKNTGRTFLEEVTKDADGNIVSKTYNQFITILFDVIVASESEGEKEDLVDDIREHFNRYEMWLDPIDFHSSCRYVTVENTNNSDVTLNTEITRGERIRIEVQFVKSQTRQL